MSTSSDTDLQTGKLPLMQMESWEFLLLLGRSERSELLCRKALVVAERLCGAESPEVGLCLMELADMLEEDGRSAESEIFVSRYRAILCVHAKKYGII